MEEKGFFYRVDVRLGAGMQFDGRKVHFQNGHVLHDERVDPGRTDFPDHRFRPGQFLVLQQRVEGYVHPGAITVGVVGYPGELLDGVAGLVAGGEIRSAEVHGIRSVVDGGDGYLGIPGWGEQFDGTGGAGHRVRCPVYRCVLPGRRYR